MKEAHEAKSQLAYEIKLLLRAFEAKTGLEVTGIDWERIKVVGERRGKIEHVDVRAEL